MFNLNVVDAVQKQSSKAISVFTETIEKLSKANEKAIVRVMKNNEKANKLSTENDKLNGIVSSNNTFISKINSLFVTNENN